MVINTPHPGICKSTLVHSVGGLKGSALKLGVSLTGKSVEEGSRTLVHAASASADTHGQFLSECRVKKPSPFVLSENGGKAQLRVWEELIEKLEGISPGISSNIQA